MTVRLAIELTDDQLATLAKHVAPLLAGHKPDADPWLDVDGAAAHLACPVSRIYDLKARGELRHAKDGSRLRFKRSWLDAYLEDGGA